MAAPILYHCPQTRGRSALWANEEVGAPCTIEIVNLHKGDQKKPDYLARNPMGKIPALLDGDVVVTEAAAICATLADRYPDSGLAPATDDPRRGAYYRWMFFAPSVVEPTMMDAFAKVTHDKPGMVGHGAPADVIKSLHHAIETGPFLLGEQFTMADVVFGSAVRFALLFGAFEKTAPLEDYVARITDRPAFKRSEERENAFAAAMNG